MPLQDIPQSQRRTRDTRPFAAGGHAKSSACGKQRAQPSRGQEHSAAPTFHTSGKTHLQKRWSNQRQADNAQQPGKVRCSIRLISYHPSANALEDVFLAWDPELVVGKNVQQRVQRQLHKIQAGHPNITEVQQGLGPCPATRRPPVSCHGRVRRVGTADAGSQGGGRLVPSLCAPGCKAVAVALLGQNKRRQCSCWAQEAREILDAEQLGGFHTSETIPRIGEIRSVRRGGRGGMMQGEGEPAQTYSNATAIFNSSTALLSSRTILPM